LKNLRKTVAELEDENKTKDEVLKNFPEANKFRFEIDYDKYGGEKIDADSHYNLKLRLDKENIKMLVKRLSKYTNPDINSIDICRPKNDDDPIQEDIK
jgi:hypothetical protein